MKNENEPFVAKSKETGLPVEVAHNVNRDTYRVHDTISGTVEVLDGNAFFAKYSHLAEADSVVAPVVEEQSQEDTVEVVEEKPEELDSEREETLAAKKAAEKAKAKEEAKAKKNKAEQESIVGPVVKTETEE